MLQLPIHLTNYNPSESNVPIRLVFYQFSLVSEEHFTYNRFPVPYLDTVRLDQVSWLG